MLLIGAGSQKIVYGQPIKWANKKCYLTFLKIAPKTKLVPYAVYELNMKRNFLKIAPKTKLDQI